MSRAASLFLLAAISFSPGCDPRSRSDQEVSLRLSRGAFKREFRIGETVPIELAFSSRVDGRYRINQAHYDRSGRMSYEQFTISPPGGAVDPLPHLDYSLGGRTGYEFLTHKPWKIRVNLNEWVRFTAPGQYKLVVSSQRVDEPNLADPAGRSPVTLRSNEVLLTIVPADPSWQKRVYAKAVATLDTPPKRASDDDKAEALREQALETLRFLGTPEATRTLVKRLRPAEFGRREYICYLGVIASPARAVARVALDEALADPEHPISDRFLEAFRRVHFDSGHADAEDANARRHALNRLLDALPSKRGSAFALSLETALDLARADQTVPPETIAGLVAQLRAVFDQLPASKQEGLLSGGWHQIRSPDWLPIVQRCYAGSPSPRLTGLALKRWHELDPQGARPFVLQEIARPKPRFGAREIGFLPDKTIPEVDEALAANFASEENRDSSGNLETLIARYATGTILPQVFETLDTLVGNSHCASPMAILAYALRVSPETARPRIERAIAARREGSSACHPSLFQEISRLHFDPFLEELAFAALSDPDPRLATGAAETLGKFGSSRAEAVLWQHYEQWASRWSGREAELDLAWFEENEERTAQLMLGRALFEALVNGQAWLTDRSKLERLRAHTRTRELRDALNGRFRVWNGERIRISLQPTMEQFYATVAFYSFDSFEKLKEKLLQFPSGTQFSLVVHARDRAIADPFVAELNGFLLSRGMSVREEGPAD